VQSRNSGPRPHKIDVDTLFRTLGPNYSRLVESENDMQVPGRAPLIAGLAAACLLAASPAAAWHIPPFKGNDTGGIIAWTLAREADARKLAIDHCASYGKLMRPLAAQRQYGGYISFACEWPRGRIVTTRVATRRTIVLK
jgi:hypothetical protein